MNLLEPMSLPEQFEDGTPFSMDELQRRLRESYEQGFVDRKADNLPKLERPDYADAKDSVIALLTDPQYSITRAYANGYYRAERGLPNTVDLWREAGEPDDKPPYLGIEEPKGVFYA